MRSLRPQILYLAPTWPHAKCFGQQLRVLHIGRALQQVGDVKLAVASYDNEPEAIERTAGEFHILRNVGVLETQERGILPRLRWWFDPCYQDSFQRLADEPSGICIRESLPNFDLVWINSVRLANMFGIWRWPRALLDIDDVPSTYQFALWRNNNRAVDKLKAGARILPLKQRENLLRQRFSLLAVCSDVDREWLGGGSQIRVIPNGFERPTLEPHREPSEPSRLGFIGDLRHPPNYEGIRWFVSECWPQVQRAVPGVRLRLIGKESDGRLKPAEPGVDGLGFLPDATREIATWSAMIVPLRLGSGTRLKVAEAFSRKCPLISTSFGALGYDVTDGREARLANMPEAFASACVHTLRHQAEADAMARRAWRHFLDKWTWGTIAPRVWSAAEDCLRLNIKRQ